MAERTIQRANRKTRARTDFPLWRHLVVLFAVAIGAIYAAPNLYPPDYALQVRPEGGDQAMDPAVPEVVLSALDEAGIETIGTELGENSVTVRVTSNEAQLRGQEVIQDALAGIGSERYTVALNLAPTTPEWLSALGASPMSYGLDLRGGVHFLLQVDIEKALADRMVDYQEGIQTMLREQRLRYVPGSGDWVHGTELRIPFVDQQTRDAAVDPIAEAYPDFELDTRAVDGHPGIVLAIPEQRIGEIEDFAISQNLTSLRNRVNELGVSEPHVQRLGRSRIVLDLPGLQDSARAKEIINKFANLEFRLVASPDARPAETEPFMYEGREVLLERRNIVTGERVTNATQDYDPQSGLPQVSIRLDSEGGQRMNEVTQDNVGNQMAIIFKELKPRERTVMRGGKEVVERFTIEEERVISIATIQSALGYRFRITGLGLAEARDLALLLRAGALAAPMYIVEERTVGASLGEANIERGMRSMELAVVLVVLFMLGIYKLFGLAANIALFANVMLLVAIMSVLGATLTLPGIAGIVLTVGMAVDANVLIFERIKEELDRRSPRQAIDAGFDRAFITILDANITTFLAAIVLLAIGSGPVKGFAVTLAIGIVTTVFTATVGTRSIVAMMYRGRSVRKLAI